MMYHESAAAWNVREIIDGFLSRNKSDEKLMAYALKAREGMVL